MSSAAPGRGLQGGQVPLLVHPGARPADVRGAAPAFRRPRHRLHARRRAALRLRSAPEGRQALRRDWASAGSRRRCSTSTSTGYRRLTPRHRRADHRRPATPGSTSSRSSRRSATSCWSCAAGRRHDLRRHHAASARSWASPRPHGMNVEVQCWGYTLTQAANLHVMLAYRNCTYFEQPVPTRPSNTARRCHPHRPEGLCPRARRRRARHRCRLESHRRAAHS